MSTTAATAIDQFNELVREEWTDPITVAGWRRWFPKMLVQFQAGTDLLVEAAQLEPGMQVLDLASGSGDPALALAAAVGPTGHVTATDNSPEMLALAEEHSRARGLNNLTFRRADAQALPFADQSFDRVTSKLGAMYFVDSERAMREIHRVLKPGGRVSLLAWGPFEQSPYFQAGLGPILRRAQLPPPPPNAPHPLRFASPGSLSAELQRAGFTRIEEETSVIPLPWPGAPEELWRHVYEIAAPFRPIIDGLPAGEREAALDEVIAGLRLYYDGEQTNTPASIVIASATR